MEGFFSCVCASGRSKPFYFICIPHHTGTGTWRVEGVISADQSPALSSVLPERSRADIMESDSLLASLSADGKIQAVIWWLVCQ